MKKAASALLVLFLFSLMASAQTIRTPQGVTITIPPVIGVGNTGWLDLTSYGVSNHLLMYSVAGLASAVTVAFDCSMTGDSNSPVFTLATHYTTDGGRIFVRDTQCNFIRGRVDVNTGGTGIKFTYVGSAVSQPVCNAVRRTNCSN